MSCAVVDHGACNDSRSGKEDSHASNHQNDEVYAVAGRRSAGVAHAGGDAVDCQQQRALRVFVPSASPP